MSSLERRTASCARFVFWGLFMVLLAWTPAGRTAEAQSVRKTEFSRELPGVASVMAIVEDPDGLLWIGTSHGLFRYDGYEFTRFYHTPEDSTSISGDQVSALLVSREGVLWVGTLNTGINRFDRSTGTFVRYENDPDDDTSVSIGQILSLEEDRAGHIWVATRFGGGLCRLDPERGSFTRFVPDSSDESSIRSTYIWRVTESSDGSIWVSAGDPLVAASHALARYDPETNGFTHFVHDPAEDRSILPGAVSSAFEDSEGRLWVTTIGGGVNLLDRRTGAFKRYSPRAMGPSSTLTGNIFRIKQMRSGELLLSTFGRGLCRFDPVNGSCGRLESAEPATMQAEDVMDMHEDRFGVLWVGRLNLGLLRLDRNVQTFDFLEIEGADQVDATRRSAEALTLFEDSRRTMWMGTRDGIYRLVRGGRWQQIAREAEYVNFVTSIAEDAQGYVWFGFHGNGLARFDPSSGRLTPFRHEPSDSTTLASNLVDRVILGPNRRLWVLTHGGVSVWNEETNRFEHELPTNQIGIRMRDSGVSTAAFDHDGRLWMSMTAGGLAVREVDGSVDYFAPGPDQPGGVRNQDVVAIEPDGADLWVGTCGGGIYRIRLSGMQVTQYATQNTGLPTDCIQGILVENAERLWLSSNLGIIRFEPSTGIASQYSERDGLRSLFGTGASARGADGTYYFGSILGVHAFEPQPQGSDPGPPHVLLTRARVGNVPDTPLTARRAALTNLNGSELRLSHRERDVTFDYVALHFSDPTQNRYSYRLEGHDPEWVEAGAHRQARYTNLKPGRYTFRVKAVGAAGAWNEEGAWMSVTVEPPWWRTIWAYGLYGMLLIGGVFATDRIQRKRLVRRERERARERELAQAREIERAYNELRTAKDRLVQQEKLASLGALTAGIAHEIKNPLNFVNNFASLSAEIVADIQSESAENPARPIAEIREDLNDLKLNVLKIEEHGKRADAIVRSMLDHSRGHAGEHRPVPINSLVEEYANLAYHGMRAQDASFNVTIERNLDPAAGEITLVPQDIGRVLINLINNAFQAVHARNRRAPAGFAPTVRIETLRDDGWVKIGVWDNGGGIPSSIRARIFEPFFTTKSPGEGTGLGLSLSYEIVTQGHSGRLEVDTEPGDWTQFQIELPLDGASDGQAHNTAASRNMTSESV